MMIFNVYKNNEHIFTGTANECAAIIGVSVATVRRAGRENKGFYNSKNIFKIEFAGKDYGETYPNAVKRRRNVYALYKADKFIDCGTAQELAKRRGCREGNIYTLYARHKESEKQNRTYAIKLED